MTISAIKTTDLNKAYDRVEVLSKLNLEVEVEVGEVLGYLGPNGAGKTTTIRLLLGLIKPTSGGSSIFGLDSQHQRSWHTGGWPTSQERPICGRISPEPRHCICLARSKGRSMPRTEMS